MFREKDLFVEGKNRKITPFTGDYDYRFQSTIIIKCFKNSNNNKHMKG